jgi:predicted Zn-dependent protease
MMLALRRLCERLALALAVIPAAIALLAPVEAYGQGVRFIRDAEIENIIRDYSTPLFQAAGLDPRAIQVYLVVDNSLNAFVTAGRRMFINTGLLMKSDSPLEVIGVIAHETGHIAGGHSITRSQEMRGAQTKAIAAYVLGLASALATGEPGLATAVISAGQDVALKGLLSYTRGQEQAADQAAIRYLTATGQSPRGVLEFMKILSGQEILLAANQDPYLRTHPLTLDRIAFMERAVADSAYGDTPARPEFVTMQARMQAKLIGFLSRTSDVFRAYPESDRSVPARYARTIALYRAADLGQALPMIEQLVAEHPDDPYFHELRAQMLFENGRLADALPSYRRAVELLDSAAMLRLSLAHTLVELNAPALDAEAIGHLEAVLASEPKNTLAWRLSAIAYGRKGDKGMTALALAEEALVRGQLTDARGQAARAQDLLARGSPGWLRAQDVENEATRLQSKEK